MARRSSAPAHASLLTYARAHARSRAAQRIKPACSPLSKHWTIFFLPDEQTHFLCLLILALLEIMPPQQHCSVLPVWAAWSLSSSHAPLKSHIHIPIACNLQRHCLGFYKIEMFFLSENCFNKSFWMTLMAQKKSAICENRLLGNFYEDYCRNAPCLT